MRATPPSGTTMLELDLSDPQGSTYALFSEPGLQTTRTWVPRWRFAAELRLRAFGTLPPVAGLTDASGAGSGQ
jgi:hypothetical protein